MNTDTHQPLNTRIRNFEALLTPDEIRELIPVSDDLSKKTVQYRKDVEDILDGKSDRLLVIIGPCSIHDTEAGLDYARRLKALSDEVADKLMIIMRVYFEKPRTTVGWKGLINDPHIDGSNDIGEGLRRARRFLLDVSRIGLPTATEFLDPIVPQYIADLVSWAAIGARTTESQTHREMASGLSMPVGFKNATDGSIEAALNASLSSCTPHSFLGIDSNGLTCIVNTTGNHYVHVILRGGGGRTNFEKEAIQDAKAKLEEQGSLKRPIMVDCSHGNSNKDYTRQPGVLQEVINQVVEGEKAINGIMIESNLEAGNQRPDAEPRAYGKSITDACISWETTREILTSAAEQLRS
jgi:3-deoxy-7-phosphoheptulonate synthase